MTIQEMAKKKGFFGKSYALVVSIAPKNDEEFLEEWRQIGSAILEWKKRRKKEADTIMLTIVSDPAKYNNFKAILHKIYTEEETLSPLLKSIQVMVSLLNLRGQPQEEYELGT